MQKLHPRERINVSYFAQTSRKILPVSATPPAVSPRWLLTNQTSAVPTCGPPIFKNEGKKTLLHGSLLTRASFWQKVLTPPLSCCDQSEECILQHVSQSIGTPSVMHCVGTVGWDEGGGGEGGALWRQALEMEGRVHARRARTKAERDVGLSLARSIHELMSTSISPRRSRARVPALVSVCGRVPLTHPPQPPTM